MLTSSINWFNQTIFSGFWGKSLIMTLVLFTVSACGNSSSDSEEQGVVINELMASNHSGITANNGNLYDWIEIKNTGDKTVSLKGYSLVVEKNDNDDGDKEKNIKRKSWSFPEMDIEAGECILVFASKKDKKDSKDKLHTNFKLTSTGTNLKLMRDTSIVSEVEYGPLENDQCYRRLDNGKYEKSYECTPGFDNTPQGYEQYCIAVDKLREGPLRLWELHAKGHLEGLAWVEIKNVSDQPVNLQDYCLTTSAKNMSQWRLPQTQLQPGQVYVVESKDNQFKINSSKSVMLTMNGKFVDGICANCAPNGVSVGRVKDKSGLFFFSSPTPGAENNTSHYRFMTPMPTFDVAPGVHPGKKEMIIHLDTHGHTVHYTTNGTIPTDKSPVYKDSIRIDSTTTIRAYCEGDTSSIFSNTITGTFIFADKHTMPVMNITVPNSDLYDHNTGIYVEGPGAQPQFPHPGANYWQKWWKKAHVEFFDDGDGFSEECELGIFGGFSRALAKKSFKIRFKNVNGPAHIIYDLFGNGKPQKYKNFVLRSGSQDINGVMVRDEFFTSLMKDACPDLLVQAYRPIALYINGSYFGLYYIREKIDKHYVERHLDVPADSATVVQGNCKGQILDYISSHDLSTKENYEYVKQHYNVETLIDYKLGELYASNTDIGNMKHVQARDMNGSWKWHVVYYDIDNSWRINAAPAMHFSTAGNAKRVLVNRVVSALLRNKEFRTQLIERLSYHLHNTFTPQHTTQAFDNIINTIKPEMERNCQRWPNVMTYPKWEKNVEAFREKFKERNKTMLNDMRSFLSITDEENKKYFADLGY